MTFVIARKLVSAKQHGFAYIVGTITDGHTAETIVRDLNLGDPDAHAFIGLKIVKDAQYVSLPITDIDLLILREKQKLAKSFLDNAGSDSM